MRAPLFPTVTEQTVAQLAYEVIRRQEHLPSSAALQNKQVMADLVREVQAAYVPPAQLTLPGTEASPPPDVEAIVVRFQDKDWSGKTKVIASDHAGAPAVAMKEYSDVIVEKTLVVQITAYAGSPVPNLAAIEVVRDEGVKGTA